MPKKYNRTRKRNKRPPDVFAPRFSLKHRRLEALIKELRETDQYWLIRILANALVDLTFDVTGEDKRGGAA